MTDLGSHFQGGNSERYILGSIHRLPGNLRVFHNPSVCKIVLNTHLDVKTEGNLLKEGHFGQFYPAIGGTSSRLGHEIVKK